MVNVSRLSFNFWFSRYQSSSLKDKKGDPVANKTTELIRKRICCTLSSINIVDVCISAYASCVFSLWCQVLVLTIVTAVLAAEV